jgi:segregation and condensation protein B|tara:strand:- start:2123 stop:2704 length:582 start_codon:yes stop_codon:yes gene_type:complete
MQIKDRIEALLLASNRSLTLEDIHELLNIESKEDESEVINSIQQLRDEYKDKAYDLIEVSSGYRVQISHESAEDIAKLWEVKPLKLSRATLETLSIIAYTQPVTRGDIEDIRGVNVATNIIKLLIDQGWIKIKGYRDVPGRPALFITTEKFLDDFSMKSLDELPVLPDLPEIENISPELTLQDDSIEQEAPKS